MNKEELKKIIENIEVTYDYLTTYTELQNAVIDYENETQDWNLEHLFDEYITYEIAEEMAKRELEKGGLIRLNYFLRDVNFNNDIFKINGYGNIENITIDDLKILKDEILENIKEMY